jgi:hypothetical protein
MTDAPAVAEPESRRQRRDLQRGYAINYAYVAIAYFGELVLIAASLIGAWLFAQKYGDGTNDTLIMMMLAPVSYAVVEMCRVPMAIAFRTQRNILLKTVLFIGLVCAAGVTVKSLSQLGEQMFHPRLRDVADRARELNEVQSVKSTFEKKLMDANARVEQSTRELNAIETRRTQLESTRQSIPPPKCQLGWATNREGRRYATRVCDKDDPRLPAVESALKVSAEDWTRTKELLETAKADQSGLDRRPDDRAVDLATTAYRKAVRDSQLHSFTAMAFRKAPSDVTDGEIHAFLFFFVFFPAIFASVAATLLALGSVTRIDQPPRPISLADQAGAYMLGPLAEHIIRQTTEAVHKSAQSEVAEAAARASGPRIKAVT